MNEKLYKSLLSFLSLNDMEKETTKDLKTQHLLIIAPIGLVCGAVYSVYCHYIDAIVEQNYNVLYLYKGSLFGFLPFSLLFLVILAIRSILINTEIRRRSSLYDSDDK